MCVCGGGGGGGVNVMGNDHKTLPPDSGLCTVVQCILYHFLYLTTCCICRQRGVKSFMQSSR